MDVMELSTRIENKLKEDKLVGERIGSGYYFPSGERDVQYEYNPKNNDHEAILNVVDKFARTFNATGRVKFTDDSFTFYVSCNPQI